RLRGCTRAASRVDPADRAAGKLAKYLAGFAGGNKAVISRTKLRELRRAALRRPLNLADVVVDLEHGEVHRDDDEPDYPTHDHDHHWFEDRGQRLDRGRDLVLVEVGHLPKHAV